jgi:hypothetical protein
MLIERVPEVELTAVDCHVRRRQLDAVVRAGLSPDAGPILEREPPGVDIHELEIHVGTAIVLSAAIGRKRRRGPGLLVRARTTNREEDG